MSPSDNRHRVTLQLLDSDPRLRNVRRSLPDSFPAGWTLLADSVGHERGWLIRHNDTERLAIWSLRGVVCSIDQRKANAALAALQ